MKLSSTSNLRVVQERSLDGVPGDPEVSYTRGSDLSGSMEGAGGIGGLLGRSHDYSSGNWSTHSYYHADGNGNITYLLNASQSVVGSYKYDAYGNTLSSSGSLAGDNAYRFSSKASMNSLAGVYGPQLYYYGYRWYAPSLQRWVNRDPIGDNGHWLARNASTIKNSGSYSGFIFDTRQIRRRDRQAAVDYAFVFNEPLRRIDSFGLDSPGCDGIASRYETPCVLEACARHDECYRVNGCTAWSWLSTFRPCVTPCKTCNVEAAGAIIGCGSWDEGFDDPTAPNFYCAQCGEYFDVPGDRLDDPRTNPHFGHTTD